MGQWEFGRPDFGAADVEGVRLEVSANNVVEMAADLADGEFFPFAGKDDAGVLFAGGFDEISEGDNLIQGLECGGEAQDRDGGDLCGKALPLKLEPALDVAFVLVEEVDEFEAFFVPAGAIGGVFASWQFDAFDGVGHAGGVWVGFKGFDLAFVPVVGVVRVVEFPPAFASAAAAGGVGVERTGEVFEAG